MPLFQTADEVYAHLGRLFQEIVEDEELGPRFQRVDTVVQLRMRHPDSQVTVKLLADADREVDFGVTALSAEVVLTMAADTAHRLWLGKVNVTVALARGQINARGPVAKILALVPLVKIVRERYRSQLQAAGREDLARV